MPSFKPFNRAQSIITYLSFDDVILFLEHPAHRSATVCTSYRVVTIEIQKEHSTGPRICG